MSNPSQMSLHCYLSKIKRETEKLHLYSSSSFTSSKNWVLSNHPKKLFFSFRHKRRNNKTRFAKDDHVRYEYQGRIHVKKDKSATLSDIDHFLEKNFKSLFIKEGEKDDEDQVTKNKEKRKLLSPSSSDDDDDDDDYRHRFERTWRQVEYTEPKGAFDSFLKLVRSSKYASPPSPGSSEGRPSMDTTSTSEERHSRSNLLLSENCISVIKYTEEPEKDFKRSMMEMLETKLRMGEGEVDCDSIKELLLCYLNLNDEKSHKYILNAFVDLIITLLREEKENSKITREGLVRLLCTREVRERLRRE